MKVLFDTNAFLMPFEFGVNPYDGVKGLVPKVELITINECVRELKGLKPTSWEKIMSLALQNGLRVVDSEIKKGKVDDRIVEFAKNNNCLVLTQDRLLKKKLLNSSLRVIIMRQKKYFEIIG